jgi:hypothetical protein
MKSVLAALKLKNQIEQSDFLLGYAKGYSNSDDEDVDLNENDSDDSDKEKEEEKAEEKKEEKEHVADGDNQDERERDTKRPKRLKSISLKALDEKFRKLKKYLKKHSTSGKERVYFTSVWDEVTIDGQQINSNNVQEFYETRAQQGTFGDMTTCTTKVDTSVRSARDVLNFDVSPEMLTDLKRRWDENMYPPCSTIKPYKVHFYGPGDHFAAHKDTPETLLIGTIVITLAVTDDFDGGKLVFHHVNDAKDHVKDHNHEAEDNVDETVVFEGRWNGQCVMFFPDVVHEVKPVISGYTARAAFKVFGDVRQIVPSFDEASISFAKELFTGLENVNFGVLFGFKYSSDSQILKGIDQKVLEVLQNIFGTEDTRLIPVSVSATLGERAAVYDVSDDVLEQNMCLAAAEDSKSYPFATLSKGLTWKDEHERGAEYTGNEARPESRDSVYVHMAFVHLP